MRFYAITLFPDKEAEKFIIDLWQKFESESFVKTKFDTNCIQPHLTLAIYNNEINLENFRKKIDIFFKKFVPFEITLISIGVFKSIKNTIYLLPSFTKKLFQIHEDFCNEFDEFNKYIVNYYDKNNWVPHFTLASGITNEEIYKIFNYCFENLNFPISVRIEKIALVELIYDKIELCGKILLKT